MSNFITQDVFEAHMGHISNGLQEIKDNIKEIGIDQQKTNVEIATIKTEVKNIYNNQNNHTCQISNVKKEVTSFKLDKKYILGAIAGCVGLTTLMVGVVHIYSQYIKPII